MQITPEIHVASLLLIFPLSGMRGSEAALEEESAWQKILLVLAGRGSGSKRVILK